MQRTLITALFCATRLMASEPVTAETGYVPLFNGKDFNDWTLLLRDGTPEEVKQVFTIDPDGTLHFFRDLPNGTGSETRKNCTHGLMTTKRNYRYYSLKFDYKWGSKQVNNFASFQYDAGVFYHISELKIFPIGLQYQVRYNHLENRNHSGDFIASETTLQWFSQDGKTFEFPTKGGTPQPRREGQHYAHATAPFHGLGETWNECELIVMGDEFALHRLNGQIVNLATQLPVAEGPIALESETAEIFWRNIRIKEFPAPIPMTAFLH
jgi:hypothetical protein